MPVIVHIVAGDQTMEAGKQVGLCGAKVNGLYVRHKGGPRQSHSHLCGECVAVSDDAHRQVAERDGRDPT